MAARHWVGGTASWDGTAGTKWSLTNGGAGGQAVPTSADDVFFDSGSGAAVVTIAIGNTGAKSVNCTGYTGTIAGGTAISISGSVTLVAGMTFTNTSQWTIIGTGTVTFAGNTFANLAINGAGITVTPADIVSVSASLTLTQGTWAANTNNPAHNIGSFLSTGSSTRTLNLGNGVWTLSTTWSATATGMTFNKNAGNLKFTGSSTAAVTIAFAFSGGGLVYNDVWFSGSKGLISLSGSNTFADWKIDGNAGVIVNITSGSTTTVSSLSIAGASGGAIILQSSTLGTQATISDASGTNTLDWCAIRDLAFTGGATFAATNSYDMGDNSGITITGPGGGAGMLFIPNLEAT